MPIVLAVVAIGLFVLLVFIPSARVLAPAEPLLPVKVVDSTSGDAISGAQLSPDRLGESPALVRVTAPGHEPRTVALAGGQAAVVPLLKSGNGALSLQFGGDVMMGRRFYDSVEGRKPLLPQGATVQDHARVLQHIAPLLRSADLSVVNLEGPLLANPIVPPDRAGFLPGKPLVFASSTALAQALKESGVEVVGLGNNHLYDALTPGVQSTLAALDSAGIAHFGGGLNEAQAWQPALVHAGGQTVAIVGCTTVTGYGTDAAVDTGDATAGAQDTSFVAGPDKAGAADCQTDRLTAAVAQARQQASVVAVVIHGGVEYRRTQTAEVQRLATAAAEAGATVVVGGHPHVVGGITTIGAVPWVASTGNLTFDQDLWLPSFSYLTRFDIVGGSAVRTSIDPFIIRHYVPVPVVGSVADATARIAAGTVSGPLTLGDGTAEAPHTPAAAREVEISRDGGPVVGVPAGAVLPAGTEGGGTDLLYGTGTFERFATGGLAPGAMWDLGEFAKPSTQAACDGSEGIELLRTGQSHKDVIVTTDHRVPVTAGTQLSLVVTVRAVSPEATMELHWYGGLTGASTGHRTVEIPVASTAARCHQIRLDVTVPPGVVAAAPTFRLVPSGHAVQRLWIDDVRLISWNQPTDQPVLSDVVDLGKAKAPLTVKQSPVR